MRYYYNWEDLTAAAQKVCQKILEKDVAPVVKEILGRHIKSDIYDVYTRKTNGWVIKVGDKYKAATYKRRHILEDSLISVMTDVDEIMITSKAPPRDPIDGSKFNNSEYGAFLNLLETGRMGLWRGGFPRPAVSNAQREVNRSSGIKKAIKDGLDKRF